jgi:uncharacterized protein (UPF0335 family)
VRVGAQLDRFVTRVETLHHDRETADAIVTELYNAAYREGFADGLEQGHQDALVSYEGMEDE